MKIQLKNVREDLTVKKTPLNTKLFFIVGAVRKIKPKRNLGMKEDDTPYPYIEGKVDYMDYVSKIMINSTVSLFTDSYKHLT